MHVSAIACVLLQMWPAAALYDSFVQYVLFLDARKYLAVWYRKYLAVWYRKYLAVWYRKYLAVWYRKYLAVWYRKYLAVWYRKYLAVWYRKYLAVWYRKYLAVWYRKYLIVWHIIGDYILCSGFLESDAHVCLCDLLLAGLCRPVSTAL